jgi:hypothetical protein
MCAAVSLSLTIRFSPGAGHCGSDGFAFFFALACMG